MMVVVMLALVGTRQPIAFAIANRTRLRELLNHGAIGTRGRARIECDNAAERVAHELLLSHELAINNNEFPETAVGGVKIRKNVR